MPYLLCIGIALLFKDLTVAESRFIGFRIMAQRCDTFVKTLFLQKYRIQQIVVYISNPQRMRL